VLNHGAFERRLASAGSFSLLVFFVFFATLAYWQVFRTDLAGDDRNPRVLSDFYDPGRGSILDRDGNVLAQSLGDGTRYYTDASVAHAVGYLDPRYGSQGVELAFNQELAGQRPSGWAGALKAELNVTASKATMCASPSTRRSRRQPWQHWARATGPLLLSTRAAARCSPW